MVTVSLDSPSCEVTLLILYSVVFRDVTRQAKGLYRLKHVGALRNGLAYLSRYNSGWFCHSRRPTAAPAPARAASAPPPSDRDPAALIRSKPESNKLDNGQPCQFCSLALKFPRNQPAVLPSSKVFAFQSCFFHLDPCSFSN
jgi:hypothetical protein